MSYALSADLAPVEAPTNQKLYWTIGIGLAAVGGYLLWRGGKKKGYAKNRRGGKPKGRFVLYFRDERGTWIVWSSHRTRALAEKAKVRAKKEIPSRGSFTIYDQRKRA